MIGMRTLSDATRPGVTRMMESVLEPHGAQLRFAFDEASASISVSLDGTLGDRTSLDRAPVFVRHPRARRYVLRLLADGTPRVTIPRRGSRREAERFLDAQRDW